MKYLFTAAIVAASLIACNSNEDKTTETKEAGHDAHASTATTVEMPPMPEVRQPAPVLRLMAPKAYSLLDALGLAAKRTLQALLTTKLSPAAGSTVDTTRG